MDTLLQDYNSGIMATSNNRFKRIVYNYDFVSGKVNMVEYQPPVYLQGQWIHQPDYFVHRYQYDAENRLTDVETSRDKMVWEKDARYFYYKHGPLARTILGQNQVQGIDYAYTLQGWLKGVNSTSVGDGSWDIGGDGKIGGGNSNIARDAFGFALHYYQNDAQGRTDYKPIGSGLKPFANPGMSGAALNTELFNGNIGAMSVNLPKAGEPMLTQYKYDQLNRLVKTYNYTGLNPDTNSWNKSTLNDYREQISYDANGNILTYKRNGDAARPLMDDLKYSYIAGKNQLDNVEDKAPDAAAGEYDKYQDIKRGQTAGNYKYDEIGNLIGDATEGINNIIWTVYGKVASITKTNGTNISYTYDASGNRISKTVNGKQTWYVRDATGNVMSIYTKDVSINSGDLTQTEIHLYGSSRLGVYNLENNVEHFAMNSGKVLTFMRGEKFFELSNHLGNVLVTVSDKKLPHSSDNATIDYSDADVVSAHDYYPFGMLMPGRKYSVANTNYRYGFNGKELDKEVAGTTTYDYGFRIYNPGLGRFLSVDPLTKAYPLLTPYQFASNSPIWGIDVDGLEFMPYLSAWFHLKIDISESTGSSIPYAVSAFRPAKISVVINSANVSSIYKNNIGLPMFDAMGVGLTPEGKIKYSEYTEIRSTGYNNLPQNPDWTFAPSPGLSGVPKSLSTSSQGMATGVFKEGDKAVSPLFQVKTPALINNVNSTSGAIKEGLKYYQMYNDSKIWSASIDLSNNVNMFDIVVKIVNGTYANNDKSNFSAFNKADLVNFVLDGKLPNNKGIIATKSELIRNINIMNVGMQIIDNHKGESHIISSGMVLPWTYYRTQVTDMTREIYQETLDELNARQSQK